MEGCTNSTEHESTASTGRTRKRKRRSSAGPGQLELVFDVTADNDPLAPYRSRIMRMLRTNGTIDDLRDDAEFIPASSANLLYDLSRESLDIRNHVATSLHLYVLIRETERIAAAVADGAASDGEAELCANISSLERLLRNVSDFALRYRFDEKTMGEEMHNGGVAGLDNMTGATKPKNFDNEDPDLLRESHRNVLWIARCKLTDLLRNVARVRPAAKAVNEPMRALAEATSDEEFARWMQARNVCDRSMLQYDPETGAVTGHRLRECNLMALWLTIKLATSRWVYLPYDQYAVKLFDELMARVAFFVSYRETVDKTSASGRAILGITGTARKKVLGLSLDMWRVREIVASAGRQEKRAERIESPTLLNMAAFVRLAGGFAHINDRFIVETERVFGSMERVLRTCAGFRWHMPRALSAASHRAPSLSSSSCLACEELERVLPGDVERFETLCSKQMQGTFKDFAREAFQDRVYSLYLKPSDAERFRWLNPVDMSSARNIIAREQRELHRRLNEEFIAPQMVDVWKALRGNPSEPAYTLLAALAASYSVQQSVDGGKLTTYVHSMSLLRSYLYNDERLPKHRSVYECLHTELETTGTLRFRNKLVHSVGLLAPIEEMSYQHPTLCHGMNSILICHNECMHVCSGGFGQAFVAWLAVMCRDEHIGGQMAGGGMLHDMWASLAPGRLSEAMRLKQQTLDRVKRWDPVKRVLNCDNEVAKLSSAQELTQF